MAATREGEGNDFDDGGDVDDDGEEEDDRGDNQEKVAMEGRKKEEGVKLRRRDIVMIWCCGVMCCFPATATHEGAAGTTCEF